MIHLVKGTLFVTALAATLAAAPASAQKTTQTAMGKGGSAHVKSEWTVGGANVVIAYGKPSLKGRPESQMMPLGAPWRTGADEATVLTTDKMLHFGTVMLKPGSYTINTIPGAKEWQIVFGTLKAPGQWGVPYQKDLELARAPMKLGKTKAPVEQVTYSIDPAKAGGSLRIEWGTVSVATPFTVAP